MRRKVILFETCRPFRLLVQVVTGPKSEAVPLCLLVIYSDTRVGHEISLHGVNFVTQKCKCDCSRGIPRRKTIICFQRGSKMLMATDLKLIAMWGSCDTMENNKNMD